MENQQQHYKQLLEKHFQVKKMLIQNLMKLTTRQPKQLQLLDHNKITSMNTVMKQKTCTCFSIDHKMKIFI